MTLQQNQLLCWSHLLLRIQYYAYLSRVVLPGGGGKQAKKRYQPNSPTDDIKNAQSTHPSR